MADANSWLDAVRVAERRGELLAAVDLAERGLAEHPDDVWLRHRAVLALARAGATEEAAQRFERYGLAASTDEDVAALGARIAKDVALGSRRAPSAHAAGRAGARALRRDLRADRRLLPGDQRGDAEPRRRRAPSARARSRARVLELLDGDDEDSYYAAATEAEAHLLLGDEARAPAALERAAAAPRRRLRRARDHAPPAAARLRAAPASTRTCSRPRRAGGRPLLRPPDRRRGHGRFPPRPRAAVAARIAPRSSGAIRRLRVRLARERRGHPLGRGAARARRASCTSSCRSRARSSSSSSVARRGAGWVERFERCLDAATAVSYATDDAFLGDDVLYRYGSELAMGLALLRARYLDAEVRQLAVWDGGPPPARPARAIDVATWRPRRPAESTVVATGRRRRARSRGAATPRTADAAVGPRRPGDAVRRRQGLLQAHRRAAAAVRRARARRVRRRPRPLRRRRSSTATRGATPSTSCSPTPSAAAACALELQDAIGAIDLDGRGLPATSRCGSAATSARCSRSHDPVLGQLGFMGSHVSRTARIEPVTPPATVYVTEPFAAALELDGRTRFACDYVGHMPAAKDYGRLRMYRLRRV